MKKIQLLDCTLRDGGYVNDWKFGHSNLISIFERLVDANVEIIEIGFLDERRPFDIDRSIMPDTASVEKIFGCLDRKQTMVLGMIDFGTCGIDHIEPCEESWLDGIRVIFKKHMMHPALEFCRDIKSKGYKVFAQMVSFTTYSDEELLELVSLVNDVKPYAVSLVDTYGICHQEDVLRAYQILDENVISDVNIGFHAHNNFQMAYANTLAFIQKEGKHDVIVDGTIFGMGKSAGNAPLELLAMRMNEKYGKNYRIDSILEAIQESAIDFYKVSPWGYKTFFYVCGKNSCHPNYLTYLEQKRNLSITKIDSLLRKIEPEEKRLLYDKDFAEKLYNDYINNEANDIADKEAIKCEITGRKILIVGPGKNIELQKKQVEDFIISENPYIISINYIPKYISVDCIFITKPNRYHDLTLPLKGETGKGVKLLVTSNVESRNAEFDFVVNRFPLLENEERIIDNSFLMLLKLLEDIEVVEVTCAGFDGYSEKEDNYCNPAMEYSFVKQEAAHLNSHMKKRIAEFREHIKICFITYSAYDVEEDINGAAI